MSGKTLRIHRPIRSAPRLAISPDLLIAVITAVSKTVSNVPFSQYEIGSDNCPRQCFTM